MIDILNLINEAKKAYNKAYAPYSKFKVGCALLLENDIYVHGCNIENASYGLSNCAERSALFSLISQGYNCKDIKAMAIIGQTDEPISPCGACRQVMQELLPEDCKIYLANLDGKYIEFSVNDLLPYSFKQGDLK